MRTLHAVATVAAFALSTTAFAQMKLDRTYNVSAKPAVQIDVDDAAVKVHGCGGCKAVHIHVDPRGADMSQWRISDLQGGNGLHFTLKHQESHGFFIGWSNAHAPLVTVDTPGETDLSVRSGDGALTVEQVRGAIDLRTGDGSILALDVSGAIRTTTGDGAVNVSRAEGSLTAASGDGSMTLEGKLSQLDAHAGDGSVNVSLLPGSSLQAGSRVTAGDGSVVVTLPRDLKIDLDATSGDGKIVCTLPMLTTTSKDGRHSVRGSVNGGGAAFRVHTGDGNIVIAAR